MITQPRRDHHIDSIFSYLNDIVISLKPKFYEFELFQVDLDSILSPIKSRPYEISFTRFCVNKYDLSK